MCNKSFFLFLLRLEYKRVYSVKIGLSRIKNQRKQRCFSYSKSLFFEMKGEKLLVIYTRVVITEPRYNTLPKVFMFLKKRKSQGKLKYTLQSSTDFLSVVFDIIVKLSEMYFSLCILKKRPTFLA